MISRQEKGLKRYRTYMGSLIDCKDEGCGYCQVCRRLAFHEWAASVAPKDVACSVSPHPVDDYIRKHYPGAI